MPWPSSLVRRSRILQALKVTLLAGAALDTAAGAAAILDAFSPAPAGAPAAMPLYPWGGPLALLVMGAVAGMAAYDFERLRPVVGWFGLAHAVAGVLGLLTGAAAVGGVLLALGAFQLVLWRSLG